MCLASPCRACCYVLENDMVHQKLKYGILLASKNSSGHEYIVSNMENM